MIDNFDSRELNLDLLSFVDRIKRQPTKDIYASRADNITSAVGLSRPDIG